MTGSLERRKGFGFGLLGAFFGAFLIANYADSLRAAGLNGQAPPNGDAFKQFVDTMTDNAIWIIGTVIVLALVVIGSAFALGHSRAQDYAAKVGFGTAVIILAPGIAA